MREIKFRGYNRKNNQWLYGFYLQNRGYHFVCPDEFANGKSWDDYEIDPATVGQFTGLKDKNGKEIYEGDIIRTPLGRFVEVRYGRKEHIVRRTRPAVTDSFMAYGWIVVDVRNECNYDFLDDEICGGEIVGNIFDNQDLCK